MATRSYTFRLPVELMENLSKDAVNEGCSLAKAVTATLQRGMTSSQVRGEAQKVERRSPKPKAASSILATPAIYPKALATPLVEAMRDKISNAIRPTPAPRSKPSGQGDD